MEFIQEIPSVVLGGDFYIPKTGNPQSTSKPPIYKAPAATL